MAPPSPVPVLLLLALGAQRYAAAGLPPVADCASLAQAALGPNVTVLSAVITNASQTSAAAAPAAAGGGRPGLGGATCTFEQNVDVGQPSR